MTWETIKIFKTLSSLCSLLGRLFLDGWFNLFFWWLIRNLFFLSRCSIFMFRWWTSDSLLQIDLPLNTHGTFHNFSIGYITNGWHSLFLWLGCLLLFFIFLRLNWLPLLLFTLFFRTTVLDFIDWLDWCAIFVTFHVLLRSVALTHADIIVHICVSTFFDVGRFALQ